VLIFTSAASAFFKVVGLVGKLLFEVGSDDKSSSVSFMVIEGTFVFKILVLIVGCDFTRAVATVGIGAWEHFEQNNLAEAHDGDWGKVLRDHSVLGAFCHWDHVLQQFLAKVGVKALLKEFLHLSFF